LRILFSVECFSSIRILNYMKTHSYHDLEKISTHIKFEVSSAIKILAVALLAVTTCCLLDVHQLSAGTCYLLLSTH
jgi:hypothetical protein